MPPPHPAGERAVRAVQEFPARRARVPRPRRRAAGRRGQDLCWGGVLPLRHALPLQKSMPQNDPMMKLPHC